MNDVRFCPYCGSKELKEVEGAFLEIGEYDGSSYRSEGHADGYECVACYGEFWVNGPNIPSFVKE